MKLPRRPRRPEPRSQRAICSECHDVQTIYVRDMIITCSYGETVMATVCPTCGQHFAYAIDHKVGEQLVNLGARFKALTTPLPSPEEPAPLRYTDLRRFKAELAEVDTLAEKVAP